ncbi:MAG: pirin family protein [Planctomycetota bacterium]
MSWIPGTHPTDPPGDPDSVEMTIAPRTADLGGFEVQRVLPCRDRRMVGPFIFWDEMGPGEFLTGDGLDVLPHPHIGLSTVTFLTRGSLEHRDSVGSYRVIEPGAVNLMTAGSGIVHSERTGPEVRARTSHLAGIQSWLASPMKTEDSAPSFEHTGKSDLPVLEADGLHVRVILGEAYGARSPVSLDWSTTYLDVKLEAGAKLPLSAETEERAVYVLRGDAMVAGLDTPEHHMLVLKPGHDVTISARTTTHLMVLGGAAMDGPRFIWWNFVASSRERIEEAKERWRHREFPELASDPDEFTPLPK